MNWGLFWTIVAAIVFVIIAVPVGMWLTMALITPTPREKRMPYWISLTMIAVIIALAYWDDLSRGVVHCWAFCS